MSTEAGILTQQYHCVGKLVKRWPDYFMAKMAGDLLHQARASAA